MTSTRSILQCFWELLSKLRCIIAPILLLILLYGHQVDQYTRSTHKNGQNTFKIELKLALMNLNFQH